MKRFPRALMLGVLCLLVMMIGTLTQLPHTSHAASSTLEVQYMPGNTSTTSNKIQADLQIVNTGSSSVALSQLTMRYWFTRDTAKAVSVVCDYAALACSHVTEAAVAVSPPATTADYYFQVGFTSGTLAASSNTGSIKIRAYKSDYSNFTQTNDYSFNASFTSFTNWQNVTLYQNGSLIWGSEPGGASTTPGPTQGTTVTPTPTQGSTVTPTPPPTGFNQAQINAAVAAPLLAFAPPTTANSGRTGDAPGAVGNAAAFYYLGIVTWYKPNATSSSGASVTSRFVASINNLIAGGNEPDANGGLEGWGHAITAQGLLLARNEPTVWNQLSSTAQSKVNLLMQALAIAANYDYNDANDFKADLDYALEGNQCKFGKTYNPNYREGYVNVMIAAAQYFGASTLNNFFTSFNYTTFEQQLQTAGFTSILTAWNGDGTILMTGSGAPCSGSGSGVTTPFKYMGNALTNLPGIFDALATYTYSATVTSTGCSGAAKIADGTSSPYQGQAGMELEFDSSDSSGCRSDALYAFEGWMNSILSRATLTVLGNWGCGTTQTNDIKLEGVGSGDLLYKLQHGYDGRYLGTTRLVNETTPSSDGPSVKGFFWDQDVWNVVLSQQKAC